MKGLFRLQGSSDPGYGQISRLLLESALCLAFRYALALAYTFAYSNNAFQQAVSWQFSSCALPTRMVGSARCAFVSTHMPHGSI